MQNPHLPWSDVYEHVARRNLSPRRRSRTRRVRADRALAQPVDEALDALSPGKRRRVLDTLLSAGLISPDGAGWRTEPEVFATPSAPHRPRPARRASTASSSTAASRSTPLEPPTATPCSSTSSANDRASRARSSPNGRSTTGWRRSSTTSRRCAGIWSTPGSSSAPATAAPTLAPADRSARTHLATFRRGARLFERRASTRSEDAGCHAPALRRAPVAWHPGSENLLRREADHLRRAHDRAHDLAVAERAQHLLVGAAMASSSSAPILAETSSVPRTLPSICTTAVTVSSTSSVGSAWRQVASPTNPS